MCQAPKLPPVKADRMPIDICSEDSPHLAVLCTIALAHGKYRVQILYWEINRYSEVIIRSRHHCNINAFVGVIWNVANWNNDCKCDNNSGMFRWIHFDWTWPRLIVKICFSWCISG
jgi:hypothetical protein